MSTREPAWLQGSTSSPCSALAWSSYDERQFCVLPFLYIQISDCINEKPQYAMWGRTLSDGQFYLIPPSVYRRELSSCDLSPDGIQYYQWIAHTHGTLMHTVPVEMQKVRAVEVGREQGGAGVRGKETEVWAGSSYHFNYFLNHYKPL
jgi:hypothetical protein